MSDEQEEFEKSWVNVIVPKCIRFEVVPTKLSTGSGGGTFPDMYRAKAPGGWLVALRKNAGFTFVPDPAHEWDPLSKDWLLGLPGEDEKVLTAVEPPPCESCGGEDDVQPTKEKVEDADEGLFLCKDCMEQQEESK